MNAPRKATTTGTRISPPVPTDEDSAPAASPAAAPTTDDPDARATRRDPSAGQRAVDDPGDRVGGGKAALTVFRSDGTGFDTVVGSFPATVNRLEDQVGGIGAEVVDLRIEVAKIVVIVEGLCREIHAQRQTLHALMILISAWLLAAMMTSLAAIAIAILPRP